MTPPSSSRPSFRLLSSRGLYALLPYSLSAGLGQLGPHPNHQPHYPTTSLSYASVLPILSPILMYSSSKCSHLLHTLYYYFCSVIAFTLLFSCFATLAFQIPTRFHPRSPCLIMGQIRSRTLAFVSCTLLYIVHSLHSATQSYSSPDAVGVAQGGNTAT